MYRVLIVDDEPNILNALRRELQGAYQLETFSSPEAALEGSHTGAIDLVIADFQMPGMNGIEFLKRFGKLQPDAVRMILSGQADFDAMVGTINQAHVYRFISKPWDGTELAAVLAQALAHRAMLQESRRSAERGREEHRWQRVRDPNRLYQVLVVDDEPNVLSAVARDLTSRERIDDLHAAMQYQTDPEYQVAHQTFRFNVQTYTSPLQALEHVRQVGYDVVIADYQMPEMDGLHFLEAMRKMRPDAARILFSSHADREVLVRAINNSEIFGYIGKPWLSYDLKSTVAQAAAFSDLLRAQRPPAGQEG